MSKVLIFLSLFCSVAASAATEIPMNTAHLRGMDKITGRTQTFSVPVNQTGQFGKTFVTVETCLTRPPEESPENSAFLRVFEQTAQKEEVELFKGWMFSSNPALSSMEHPVYDIWVLECVNEEPTKAALPAEAPKEQEATKDSVDEEPDEEAILLELEEPKPEDF